MARAETGIPPRPHSVASSVYDVQATHFQFGMRLTLQTVSDVRLPSFCDQLPESRVAPLCRCRGGVQCLIGYIPARTEQRVKQEN